VLIPKYSLINQTNISEFRRNYNIEIIEVSQLHEALREFTGKDYELNNEVNISSDYAQTMKKISDQLCARAKTLLTEIKYNETNSSNVRLYNKGVDALALEEYYSAASYCFGSSLYSRYVKLKEQSLSEEQLNAKIQEIMDHTENFKNRTAKQKLRTITDLETYMVVNDRLAESKARLEQAELQLEMNNTNASLYQLAYGIERLNSAQSWAVFFNMPGRTFKIDKNKLEQSCLKKISEVEERVQYVEIYLPRSTIGPREAIKESYKDYNEGNPELCLYKASIAKARVDLVLNNIAIDVDDLSEVIDDRSSIVKSVIGKQNSRGIFPILAYSYYEYANSLKENDQYSALLYLGYALELGNLDIYFEKETVKLPRINKLYIYIFIAGLSTGFLLGLITFRLLKRR